MKSDPRAFNLDASLLQCDLPLSLLLVKSSVALGEEEGRRLVGLEEQVCLGRRGTLGYIDPLIPDTSDMRAQQS